MSNKFTKKYLIVFNGKNVDPVIEKRIIFYFENEFKIIKLKYSVVYKYIFSLIPINKVYYGFCISNASLFEKYFLWYNIDPFINHIDAWKFHEILNKKKKSNLNINNNKFKDLISNYKIKHKSYLFGTGSSLRFAINENYEDGYIIVCNTIVKDKELWNHLKPDIIVAADALYHYSDSLFAQKFRNDLVLRFTEVSNTFLILPHQFEYFAKKNMPTISHRIIGIPTGNSNTPIVNLINDFRLPLLGNVLNLLMLPLSITLSKNIFFIGFDGRSPNDKNFWKNSDKHFYNDLVDDLKKNHPAFFNYFIPKGKEEEYVKKVHGEDLDKFLTTAESEGYYFKSMYFSYTPALFKRYNK